MPASVYQNDTGKPFEWALQYSDLSIPDLSGLTNPNFAVSFPRRAATLMMLCREDPTERAEP